MQKSQPDKFERACSVLMFGLFFSFAWFTYHAGWPPKLMVPLWILIGAAILASSVYMWVDASGKK